MTLSPARSMPGRQRHSASGQHAGTPLQRRVLAGLAASAAALLALPAAAQSSPYYIGLSQTLVQESNLVRLRDGQVAPADVSKSDLVSSTALVAGVDQRIGRQRIFGSAALRDTRFSKNDQFNSNGYNLNAGLEWATIERISGSVNLSTSRTPRPSVRSRSDALILERNVETVHGASARVSVGLVTRLSADAELSQNDLRYSASGAAFREYRQRGAAAGLSWRPGAATRLSLGLGSSRISYPNLLFPPFDANDRRTRDTVNLGLDWTPSGISRVDLRVSQGKTKHKQLSERDFSATSGSLGWRWLPSGKLQLDTRLARDVGQDSEAVTTAFTRTTDSLRVQANYSVSAKVGLTASVSTYRRDLEGNGLFVSGLNGKDSGRNFSVGARWSPLRNLSVGCDLNNEKRGRNSVALLNDAYSSNSLGCFGQFVLQ